MYLVSKLVLAIPPTLNRLLAMRSPIPGLLPGCLATITSTSTSRFTIAGIIGIIVYETGELLVMLKAISDL